MKLNGEYGFSYREECACFELQGESMYYYVCVCVQEWKLTETSRKSSGVCPPQKRWLIINELSYQYLTTDIGLRTSSIRKSKRTLQYCQEHCVYQVTGQIQRGMTRQYHKWTSICITLESIAISRDLKDWI